jgi:uncharacterized protein YndB with AHSA1/START domain
MMGMAKLVIEKLGLYTDKSVLKNTGKNWVQWVQILNKDGAAHLSHQEIVALLKKKYKLSIWWQQAVTSGYEVHIGRRREGQNAKGEYQMTATKTFPVDGKTLWKIITSAEGQAAWLKPMTPLEFKIKEAFEVRGGVFGSIRTLKAPARLRMRWQDTEWPKPTVVNIAVVPRSGGKSILALNHEAIKDPRTKEKLRVHWKAALADLLAHVLKLQK